MSFDINALEQFRSKASSIADLLTKMDSASNTKNFKDDRLWALTVDAKTGVGNATIRFLPSAQLDQLPYVSCYTHGFKNKENGKGFVSFCHTSVGEQCPVCEENSILWNTNVKENQDIVRSRKRRTEYYANILVVNDPKNPDNNGKVMVYKFGVTIMEQLQQVINPKFDHIKAVNPFDLFAGVNFDLAAYNSADGMRKYDQSRFDQQTSPVGSDEKIVEVMNSLHDLNEVAITSRLKPADEVKKQLYKVLGKTETESFNASPVAAPTERVVERVSAPVQQSAAPVDSIDDLDDLDKYLNAGD